LSKDEAKGKEKQQRGGTMKNIEGKAEEEWGKVKKKL
jgi:hypothetical protein